MTTTRTLLIASLLLALAYGLFAPAWRASGVSADLLAALKASGILLLALIALSRRSRLLAAALLFGAIGDVLLALGANTFAFGAGAFLVGHILYITLFLRNGDGVGGLKREPLRLLAMAAIVIVAVIMNALLVPSESPLFAPLMIYSAALTLMTLTTFTLPAWRWLAMFGGVCFFVSDGFVAAHVFHADDAIVASFWFGFLGWMLYWAGQAGLCLGGLKVQRAP